MEGSTRDKALEPYSRRPEAGNSFWTLGMLATWLAEGGDTNGIFALAEGIVPRGAEPPPHTHTREDEAFYVLEGEMSVRVGRQFIEAGPGDLIYLPRGMEHGFELKTPVVRALFLIAPAGLEEAFKRLGEPAGDLTLPPPPNGPPDVDGMMAVFESHGVEFGTPPPR